MIAARVPDGRGPWLGVQPLEVQPIEALEVAIERRQRRTMFDRQRG